MKQARTLILLGAAMLLLTACGNGRQSSSEPEMIYVKSTTLYDTISEIYADPDSYLGKNFHMVGTLYPSEEDNGDTADEMVARIKDIGYPEDRFTYHRAEIGGHEVSFWRSIFSEFLDAMVYQN